MLILCIYLFLSIFFFKVMLDVRNFKIEYEEKMLIGNRNLKLALGLIFFFVVIGFSFSTVKIPVTIIEINKEMSSENYENVLEFNEVVQNFVFEFEELYPNESLNDVKNKETAKQIFGLLIDSLNQDYLTKLKILDDPILNFLTYGTISKAYSSINFIDNFEDYDREKAIKLIEDLGIDIDKLKFDDGLNPIFQRNALKTN